MQKEAINTFNDGLVQDLNTLSTPNTVLTNCLNGTLITYNGNEHVLQNDMGNVAIKNAYLPKGYVPVGIKEYGGIIYVASHNPLTKKSQIGSFPSPQQLYNGEDLNVSNINFSFSKFVDSNHNIIAEYYKERLFVDNENVSKEFHPGDRFILTSNNIDQSIIDAYNKGVIKFRLGVLNKSGIIEYIDDRDLRIYSQPQGFWIFCYGDTEESLKDKSLVQVYSAKISGQLILIIELKTIDAFNLIKKYSMNEDVISVTFEGQMKSSVNELSGFTTKNLNIGLKDNINNKISQEIMISGTSTSPNTQYNISPASIYGILNRLAKKGIINFANIKPNEESSSEWRYFITDTYIKIGWSYDYYNMDQTSFVNKIEFTFIDFINSSINEDPNNMEGVKLELIKDYYNGSFEEIVPFTNLKKNWIYIVRIDRYINNEKRKTPFYRLLYTGTLFNKYYSSVFNFEQLEKENITIKIKSEVKQTVNPFDTAVYHVKTNDSNKWELLATPNIDYYRKEVDTGANISSYRYITRKQKSYKINLEIVNTYEYNNLEIVGTPSDVVLNSYLNPIDTSQSVQFTYSPEYSSNSYLIPELEINSKVTSIAEEKNNNITNITIIADTDRSIISDAGEIKQVYQSKEALRPVYEESMKSDELNQLFAFRKSNGILYCVGGSNNEGYGHQLSINTQVRNDGSVTKGTKGNAGIDDQGLIAALGMMGGGTVGLLVGTDGRSASLRQNGLTRRIINGWYPGEEPDELDENDNFIVVAWKTSDLDYRLINLASRRTEATNAMNDNILIRADLLVKWFLSQVLVTKWVSSALNIIGANKNNYTYHTPFNTEFSINISLNNPGNVDLYLDKDTKSINTRMQEWISKLGNQIHDYLPNILLEESENINIPITYGNDIDISMDNSIINCYINAYNINVITENYDYDRGKIYIGVPSGRSNIEGVMPLQKDNKGNYIISGQYNRLKNWDNNSYIDLGYNINDRFITKYALENKADAISENYYNEIYINNIQTSIGDWVEGKDDSAPDMAYNISFGEKSPYYE